MKDSFGYHDRAAQNSIGLLTPGSLSDRSRSNKVAAAIGLIGCSLLTIGLSLGCGGGGGGTSAGSKATTIAALKTISNVSSTVDPINGDNNPYALAIAPSTFTGDGIASHVQPGDLIVSNFSNAAGAQWQGTTLEALRNGVPVRVFNDVNAPVAGGGTVTTAGAVEIAFGPTGFNWMANLGPVQNGSLGNVQIIDPTGLVIATLTDPKVIGGWGQAYNGGFGGKNAFFTVNITNGTVVRINITGSNPPFTYDVLTPDLGHASSSASGTPIGPGGMVHASDDTLYVANGFNNTIVAIHNSTTITAPTTGVKILTGAPLSQPIMMTQNPINGNLIVANQLNNNLVELTTAGAVVGTKTVDSTAVNASTGAGSALFGVVASTDAAGNLIVYFVDDNDNTVKKLGP